jgi:hypothetical protein
MKDKIAICAILDREYEVSNWTWDKHSREHRVSGDLRRYTARPMIKHHGQWVGVA